MVPAWVRKVAIAIVHAVTDLLVAENDKEREDALMRAQEETKAALDRLKFGG